MRSRFYDEEGRLREVPALGPERSPITVGVDFAAAPKNTAACELRWSEGQVTVERLDPAVDDNAFGALLDRLPEGGRLGIDCPLGWPVAFTAALGAHGDHRPWPGRGSAGERGDLVWRATDRWVGERLGRWPLSVSTDRIGVTALRAAYLLDAWEVISSPIDRSGVRGPVAEVYPAAARRLWALSPVRSVPEIEERTGVTFASPAIRQACVGSEHAFDALISALVARAVALGLTSPPPSELADRAAAEGWIHLPTGPIEDLVAG